MYFFFKKKLEIASEFSPLVSFRIQKRLMPFLISCLQKCRKVSATIAFQASAVANIMSFLVSTLAEFTIFVNSSVMFVL